MGGKLLYLLSRSEPEKRDNRGSTFEQRAYLIHNRSCESWGKKKCQADMDWNNTCRVDKIDEEPTHVSIFRYHCS
ncbi:hypothetical protein TSUD_53560 [Trifolium subterraneum]|uniref:Uncharacterized protein n=1 Tax=Trifolium subterraneum TaxID=3900 RepID=A0A2Z6NKQ8_TRISU|nr:hypothetical protein TSUD_53560 [Trifolium subterraneum]